MSAVSTYRKSKIENRKLRGFSVEWDPRLVEEAVLFAAEGRRLRRFRGERNRMYGIQDPEDREAAFRQFHADWFERLGLGRVIWQSLQEQPLVLARVRACAVIKARARKDEGAELFVSPGGEGAAETERRHVGIRLLPQSLLDPESLLTFLRHELFHIADMLDPAFAYEPRLPKGELGPTHERLLQDRYRVLWDIYIDGRLLRQGRAPASVRERRLCEFAGTFPMLSDHVEYTFSLFFAGTSLTHADLIFFATNPTSPISNFQFPVSNLTAAPCLPLPLSPDLKEALHAGTRCPLCGFPTFSFEPNPDRLPAEVVARIRADFSTWQPSLGLCQQCSDLYQSRVPSLTPAS